LICVVTTLLSLKDKGRVGQVSAGKGKEEGLKNRRPERLPRHAFKQKRAKKRGAPHGRGSRSPESGGREKDPGRLQILHVISNFLFNLKRVIARRQEKGIVRRRTYRSDHRGKDSKEILYHQTRMEKVTFRKTVKLSLLPTPRSPGLVSLRFRVVCPKTA